MKIVFFEIQNWEKELLKEHFPDAVLTEEKLNNETVQKYADAEIISCFIYSAINKEVVNKMPNLTFITTRSTGYDHIDVSYCSTKNISVANVPEYGSNTVAEHTFALILNLTRKIYQSVNQSKTLNFEHITGTDLYGKTIGIIGLGKIGACVLKIASGFGMNILIYNHSQNPDLASKYGFTYVSLDFLLENSDIITLHLPLTPQTKHIINKGNILRCKKESFIINTARGGLIETEAIMMGLEKGILSGVGLDVLEEENTLNEEIAILTTEYQKTVNLKTLLYNHILINHPKVLITPHNAFNSKEALERILVTTIENIKSFLNKKHSNIISPQSAK